MGAGALIDPTGRGVSEPGAHPPTLPEDSGDTLGRNRVIAEMLGARNERRCTFGEILQTMERLGFVERRGAPPGFLTTLPKGVMFEAAVEALNTDHLESLGATRVDFPLVFDRRADDIRDLTAHYEEQHRMFPLSGPDDELRLTYAADPGLFAWLRGRRLDAQKLPYLVYSPLPAFRRRQTGEHSLRALRQYLLPDLHAICLRRDARHVYLNLVEASAKVARFLFGDAWAQFVEIAPELARREPDLAGAAAAAAGQYTVFRTIDQQTSYYSLKGGINVDSGAGAIMLFNFQWDEVNPIRFGFSTRDGPLAVIHATAAGALAKVLPLVVGRGLSGFTPRVLPVELSPVQVVVLPVAADNGPPARNAVERLDELGFRVALGSSRGPIGSRIKALRAEWNPYHAVIGSREVDGAPLRLRSPTGGGDCSPEELVAARGDRLAACRITPRLRRLDDPFLA